MTLQYTVDDTGDLTEGNYQCYAIWNRNGRCENCISAKALTTMHRQTKYEFIGNNIYYVVAKYIEMDGVPYILEIVSDVTDEVLFGALGKSTIIKKIQEYNTKLYRDSLTGALNRLYYDEQLLNLGNYDAVALSDVDNFKRINDNYGHHTGDLALQAVSRCFMSNMRVTDSVIRYGGDEFLLVFRNIPEKNFNDKLDELLRLIQGITIDEYPDIKITVSIGGCFKQGINGRISDTVKKADAMLYRAKTVKNRVVCEKTE
jgi:putative two-component system response regulator